MCKEACRGKKWETLSKPKIIVVGYIKRRKKLPPLYVKQTPLLLLSSKLESDFWGWNHTIQDVPDFHNLPCRCLFYIFGLGGI